jgi:hypothetical protein
LTKAPVGSLDQHPLEHYLVPPEEWPDTDIEQHAAKFTHLLEVYIDDFIQLAQTSDPAQLKHLSWALLHAIHSVFPPPAITGHDDKDPVSLKKLKQGEGTWDTKKEILGWVLTVLGDASNCPRARWNDLPASYINWRANEWCPGKCLSNSAAICTMLVLASPPARD